MAQVNDIFVEIFGYNMTLVSFYQVVDVTKSGKTVKVRPIVARVVDGNGGYSGTVAGEKDNFVGKDTVSKRINKHGGLSIRDYSTAYPWNGTPVGFNHMD